MTDHLEDFRDGLASGDPDEVNPAIKEVGEMDADERAELFDDAFEMCLNLYDEGDEYQRQSVVRFVPELVPRRRLFEVFERVESEADLADHLTPEDMEQALDRLQAFYLAALEDDDGRVRLAAIKGLKNVTVVYQMSSAEERLDEILAHLDEMIADASGKTQEHIQRARQDVQFRQGPTLEEMLSDSSDSEQ